MTRTEIIQVDASQIIWSKKPASENMTEILNYLEHPKLISCPAEIQQIFENAKQMLEQHQVIGLPTETVYGLAANALDPLAIQQIYAVKKRPLDNPLIVHVSSLAMARGLCLHHTIPDLYLPLIAKFWPGPLTIILPRHPERVPMEVTGAGSTGETVAVRFPNHVIARALIEMSGMPLSAPSANISGKASPTLAQHVFNDLNGWIPMILSGDDSGAGCEEGVESTVLNGLCSPPVVLRPGSISVEAIRQVPGFESCLVHLHPQSKDQKMEKVPMAPGMKYKHYAPSFGKLVSFVPTGNSFAQDGDEMNAYLLKETLIAFESHAKIAHIRLAPHPFIPPLFSDRTVLYAHTEVVVSQYTSPSHTFIDYHILSQVEASSIHDEYEIMAKRLSAELYKAIRMLDESLKVEVMYIMGLKETGTGRAVMNRIYKASDRIDIQS